MDALVNPLEKSMANKTKPDVVKQEVDHNEDMIRSALHAIDSLNWIKYVTLKLTFFFLDAHEIFCLLVNILTIYPLGFDGTEQLACCLTAVSLLHNSRHS
jgi:hypothetical protein